MFEEQLALLQKEAMYLCETAQKRFGTDHEAFKALGILVGKVTTSLLQDETETKLSMLFFDIMLRRFLLYTNFWVMAKSSMAYWMHDDF